MLEKSNIPFQIKPYDGEDWKGIIALFQGFISLPIEEETRSVWTFAQQMKKPGFVPEKDIYVAVWEGKIVGYLQMTQESPIGRLIMDMFVFPEFRRHGIGTAFVQVATKRAETENLRYLHHCQAEIVRSSAQDFLLKRGFQQVRCFQTLEADLSLFQTQNRQPDSFKTGFFLPGDEGKLADLQNRIFRGSWGFCPNTPQEIRYYLELTQCSIGEVMVLQEGEETVGYVWPHFIRMPERRDHLDRCRIHMFGILDDHRRKGKGKELLISALKRMRDKGYRFVELTVDEKNSTARKLYQELGFHKLESLFWFEKQSVKQSDNT
jgi:mycothiol synthase